MVDLGNGVIITNPLRQVNVGNFGETAPSPDDDVPVYAIRPAGIQKLRFAFP
jgi:hypothetical protein